ncbi:MAG: nucleoside triphosphate pyrophosphohydrolase [Bdellovibrionales bacterium]|nr:nucleoside triphosphate pyrophosphohydrolase [Bdellovibrionales bacterium]
MKRAPKSKGFQAALDVVCALRSPGGCPWDREQTHLSLRPFLLEEAHELLEVLDQRRVDPEKLKEELGDVLLQVLLHARLAEERGHFTAHDVADSLARKLVRRHPHVFGSAKLKTASAVIGRWERIKNQEKKGRRVLDGIPKSLPSLQRAAKVIDRVSRVGFQWENLAGPLEKLREEMSELENDLARLGAARRVTKGSVKNKLLRFQIEAEVGDVLFSLVNVCYFLGIEPEGALRSMLSRFEGRFRHVENRVKKSGKRFQDHSLEELDVFWNEAKRRRNT